MVCLLMYTPTLILLPTVVGRDLLSGLISSGNRERMKLLERGRGKERGREEEEREGGRRRGREGEREGGEGERERWEGEREEREGGEGRREGGGEREGVSKRGEV